jgi:hypothetical protein
MDDVPPDLVCRERHRIRFEHQQRGGADVHDRGVLAEARPDQHGSITSASVPKHRAEDVDGQLSGR